ncbi:MAG: hypothetical protein ACFN4K_07630, partial [Pauljensenia sp.]
VTGERGALVADTAMGDLTFYENGHAPLQWDDGWTIVTADRSRTAQFEHTIVVTEEGADILTLP